MLFSAAIVPLITMSVAVPSAWATHVDNPARRTSLVHRDIDSLNPRRHGHAHAAAAAAADGNKRIVRKKKRKGTCAAKSSDAASSLVSSSTSDSSASVAYSTSPVIAEAVSVTSSETESATASASAVENLENWAGVSSSTSHWHSFSASASADPTADLVSSTISADPADPTSNATVTADPYPTSSANSTDTSSNLTSSYLATTTSATSSSTSTWYLVDEWSGSSFFDNWDFWSYTDPTHGTVEYVSSSDAWSDGLVSINSDGHAIMSVDTTAVVTSARKSVRIQGNKIFTGGMVIMDAYHMPTGCGTWPAWWQNGPNWPEGGEIDIIEGVNEFTENQVSLHTGVGCTIPSTTNDDQLATLTTGDYDSYDCSSTDTSNEGCGARDETTDNSYGASFNSVSGGVYAMRWSKAGIAVWWFQRGSIPDDITNDSPDPSGWGTPVANFVSDSCSPYEFFYDNFNILDTTLCGDWAGADSVWSAAGYAGQDESCASLTGYSTCSDYVLNNGAAFADAYWEVASVKYYNSTSEV